MMIFFERSEFFSFYWLRVNKSSDWWPALLQYFLTIPCLLSSVSSVHLVPPSHRSVTFVHHICLSHLSFMSVRHVCPSCLFVTSAWILYWGKGWLRILKIYAPPPFLKILLTSLWTNPHICWLICWLVGRLLVFGQFVSYNFQASFLDA